MGCLTEPFRKEQKEYYLHTSQWMNVHPQQLLGSPACFKKYDLHKLTLEELQVGQACSHVVMPGLHGAPGLKPFRYSVNGISMTGAKSAWRLVHGKGPQLFTQGSNIHPLSRGLAKHQFRWQGPKGASPVHPSLALPLQGQQKMGMHSAEGPPFPALLIQACALVSDQVMDAFGLIQICVGHWPDYLTFRVPLQAIPSFSQQAVGGVLHAGTIEGAGLFKLQPVCGSEENPADCDVKLSTAPDPTGESGRLGNWARCLVN
eukprot:scaffold165170_cov20-Tisochrysis_lutea.AAC.1